MLGVRKLYKNPLRQAVYAVGVRLYGLTHPRKVEAFRTSPALVDITNGPWPKATAREIAYACRRRLTPRRTYVSSDHLGFRYERPYPVSWHWLGHELYFDWRAARRQHRERGVEGIPCRRETGRESAVLEGAPEYCHLPIGHDGPCRGGWEDDDG